jgi:GT2 family glycosyltransferase
VPTYNRGEVLVETLRQIIANDHPDCEIVVVDQTSAHAPDVERRIEELERHPSLTRLRLPCPNVGAARNLGLRHASGDVVVYCDDDLRLGRDLVAHHVDAYRDPRVGAVAGRVLGPGSDALALDTPEVGVLRADGSYVANFHREGRRFVDHGIGCNMSFRRSTLLRVGGFDERFQGSFYREESDAFARVKKLGYDVLFEPAATVTHLSAPEGGCRTAEYRRRMYSTFRNETLFFLKNLRLRHLPRFVARVVRWMYATTRSNGFPVWTFPYYLTAFVAGSVALLGRPDRVTRALDRHCSADNEPHLLPEPGSNSLT